MATLGTRSSVMLDLDGDGDLDIVTNEFNARAPGSGQQPGRRSGRCTGWAWRLAGSSSNRNGLGAAVRVSSGGRVLTQWHDGKSGYLSQSVLPLYFGLGDAKRSTASRWTGRRGGGSPSPRASASTTR